MDIEDLLKEEPLKAWIPFGEDDQVLMRHVTRDKMRKIVARVEKIAKGRRQGAREPDGILMDIYLAQDSVEDWTFKNGGEPWPCTPENIETLVRKWNKFGRFVNDVASDFEAIDQAKKDAERKNSLNTSGPVSTSRG